MGQNKGFNAGAGKLNYTYSPSEFQDKAYIITDTKGETVGDYIVLSSDDEKTRLDALCHVMSGKQYLADHNLKGTTLFAVQRYQECDEDGLSLFNVCQGTINFHCLKEEGVSIPVARLSFTDETAFNCLNSDKTLQLYCATLSQPAAEYRSKDYPRTKRAKAHSDRAPEVRV